MHLLSIKTILFTPTPFLLLISQSYISTVLLQNLLINGTIMPFSISDFVKWFLKHNILCSGSLNEQFRFYDKERT